MKNMEKLQNADDKMRFSGKRAGNSLGGLSQGRATCENVERKRKVTVLWPAAFFVSHSCVSCTGMLLFLVGALQTACHDAGTRRRLLGYCVHNREGASDTGSLL